VLKPVDTSSGFMSGVGRRVTSLIFGSSSQFNLNKNVQVNQTLNLCIKPKLQNKNRIEFILKRISSLLFATRAQVIFTY